MTSKLAVLAAALMTSIAAPAGVAPAFAQAQAPATAPAPAPAQDGQAVRDALSRAQQGAERRAVEDLINRLRGTPAQAAPAAPPAGSAATPAAIPIPPATGTPPAQPTAAAPAAAPASAPAAPAAAATAARPAPAPAPAGTATPVSAPAAGVAAGTPPAARPATSGAPTIAPAAAVPAATGPAAPPPAVTVPRGGDVMAKAPEIAEKMNLPRTDIEVFFPFNSAEITPEAMTTLTVMGQALSDPQLAGQRFLIGGHTDGKGRPDFNLNLSKRRADNVRKFIIEHYKIEPARLVARGYGKSRLKNAAMPSADENRRVQVINVTRMTAAARPGR